MSRFKSGFEGVLTAMITPFRADGSLDLPAARALARRQVEGGAHGVVVAGTSGESPTLDDDEQISLLDAILEEVGDEMVVICGTGTNDTRHTVALTARAAAAGAHGALVVAPYYNKPNPAGLRAHFAAVASACDLPIILYNIPSRCVINMPPPFLAELAAEHATIVAVKQANNDELAPIPGLDLLAGNDEIFLRTLELGGTGGICVASNLVPARLRAIFDAQRAGDTAEASRLDAEMATLYEAMAVAVNPIPVKAASEMLGLCGPTVRLPLVVADVAERTAIEAVLGTLDLPASI